MIELKACQRCLGDMLVEEYLGDVDLVCLQCGNRQPAPVTARVQYPIRVRRDQPARKAA